MLEIEKISMDALVHIANITECWLDVIAEVSKGIEKGGDE